MTPDLRIGSHFVWPILLVISTGCSSRGEAQPASQKSEAPRDPWSEPAHTEVKGESCLGVSDKGVFSDLDDKVQLELPAKLAPERVSATVDRDHKLIVRSIDGYPRKAYPLGGSAALKVGTLELALRPGDKDELAPLLVADRTHEGKAAHDRDGDGIPDPLDILIGAKKAVANADAYTAE